VIPFDFTVLSSFLSPIYPTKTKDSASSRYS
jgi:hypothetical protein